MHSRDPCSAQADINLGPNIARLRLCVAAACIIGYSEVKCKLRRREKTGRKKTLLTLTECQFLWPGTGWGNASGLVRRHKAGGSHDCGSSENANLFEPFGQDREELVEFIGLGDDFARGIEKPIDRHAGDAGFTGGRQPTLGPREIQSL